MAHNPDNIVTIKHTVRGVPRGKTAQQIETNLEYYPWRIYIDGTTNALAKIKKVVYRLNDESFQHNEVEGNPNDNFSYEIFGYGNFEIICFIYFDNRMIQQPYQLEIDKSNEDGIPVSIG